MPNKEKNYDNYKEATTGYNSPRDSNEFQKLFKNKIWLSTREAALYLDRSQNAIWILVCRGLIIKRKWQGRLSFSRIELDRFRETPTF